MLKMALHHIALGARDVEGVAAFYRDLLGLPELARHHDGNEQLRSVWLALSGAVLMIERTRSRRRPVNGVGAGLFLIAVRATPSGRRAAELRLAAAGYSIESRTSHTSYARDPEGNRVAVSSHPLGGRTRPDRA